MNIESIKIESGDLHRLLSAGSGDATLLYYLTEEAQEGGRAFLEKRRPDFSKNPLFP